MQEDEYVSFLLAVPGGVAVGPLLGICVKLETESAMPQRASQRASARWYVVQVATGREESLCRLIERLAPEGALEECFTPRYATEMTFRGFRSCSIGTIITRRARG